MSKKQELLEKAKSLGLSVSEKNTIAEIESAIASSNVSEATSEETKLAKSGKHSAKGVKEAEEKYAKIERQKHSKDTTEENLPSAPAKKEIKPTRSKLERRGRKYQSVISLIDKGQNYSLAEAIELALKTNPSKFNASVELHIKLGVDPRQADQNIRGTVSLPAGSGKKTKIAVFADVEDVKKAKDAGADIAGGDEFLQKLEKEELDFDILISTPQMMPKLGKYARVLGPKGLMPNPKSGTVTKDVALAVKESKAGKVEYRVDSTGIIHLSVGKTNFKASDLMLNTSTIIDAVKSAKPSSIKGSYIQSVYLATTMGPSVKINHSEL